MTDEGPPSGAIDSSKPNVARMYDHLLGGKDNYAVDREAAERLVAAEPIVPRLVRANRAVLRRVVRYLAGEVGIDQFIDIGTGLPTQANVHEIAHELNPDARVVYVDYDPIVVAHSQALLGGADTVTTIGADLRRPQEIVEHPETQRLIDFDRPAAVLLFAILHFINDEEDPAGVMTYLRDSLASGSYLALTHACGDQRPESAERFAEVMQKSTAPGIPRSGAEILTYFGDFALVEPGLVWGPEWRPDVSEAARNAADYWFVAGLGRKP